MAFIVLRGYKRDFVRVFYTIFYTINATSPKEVDHR
jgi:hypothetical protein